MSTPRQRTPSVAGVAGACADYSPKFPTGKLRKIIKFFFIQEGWQGREEKGRYLRFSVSFTLEPWPETELAELAKNAGKTV